tara:strand:- start:1140 stop:1766 length:627 start_codon:yes stop_codon:yes gene_type:complete
MNVSFTTTACSRPEILRKTYESFSSNLTGIDFSKSTLYINIDPVPEAEKQQATLEVAKSFFGNVVHRTPDKPNFTAAVNWLWSQADSDYIFHLEDDWELLRSIGMNDVLKRFDDPDILEVAFRAYKYPYKSLCLSPSVWRKSLYKRFAGKLNEELNPEVQLRVDGIFPKNITCMGKRPIIKDTGRPWLSKSDFQRPKTKARFTSWEKK